MRSINYYGSAGSMMGGMNAPSAPSTTNPVEEYLAWKASYSKIAHIRYKIWVNRFQQFVGKKPEQLTIQDIYKFLSLIGQRYAPKNVQYGMTIISNYLRFFHFQGRLSLPLYLVKIPNAISNTHHAITEEEYQKILAVLGKKVPMPLRDICIIRLLHDTGMRVGELCSLTIDDITPDKSAIIRTEKTTRKRRVFWSTETDNLLKLYLNLRNELNLKKKTNSLFIGFYGKYTGGITSRSVQRMIENLTQEAGIKNEIRPHSFRHGFIHRLAKKRVTDAVISQMVGHRTPHTVSEYTKLSRVELEDAYRELFDE